MKKERKKLSVKLGGVDRKCRFGMNMGFEFIVVYMISFFFYLII